MQERLDIDLELLARHLAGEASTEERRIVEQWIDTHPAQQATFAGLARGVFPNDAPRIDVAAVRAQIAERTGVAVNAPGKETKLAAKPTDRLAQHSGSSTPLATRRSGLRRPGAWYSIASVALSAIALVVGWQWSEARMSTKLGNEMSVYTTQNGQRSAVTLPDGSTVVLSVASRLEVPANYSTGNRTLKLNGEAYFTVAHRQNAPFTVMAGPSVTRVLGTRFVVRAYDTDPQVLVAVRDGKVAVGEKTLTAMQQITVSSKGEGQVQRAEAAQFGIASGILAFANTPLREAIPALERWYDVDVQIGDPALDSRRITIELAAGSANDLIEMLEYSFNIRVVREGRVLTLYRR